MYGTLKRGECREHAWPVSPQRIVEARIQAHLYDLGVYPAIVVGDDWVVGERWEFRPDDMAATLDTLDRIEGYQDAADDLYRRQIVPCFDQFADDVESGDVVNAFAYFYVRSEQLRRVAKRIMPDNGVCRWCT